MFWGLLVGAIVSLWIGLVACSSVSWNLTSLLLAKGFALTNLVALLGLYVQRRGYRKILHSDNDDDALFAWSFLACFLLFFGLCETGTSFFLSRSFRKISKSFRPFTGLQMFSQLPEATIVFCLGSFLALISSDPLPVIVLQQALLLRLMLGGGLGKLRGNWTSGLAMQYHYWTQPLPNILSRQMHLLPAWLHKLESYATLVVEGPVTGFLQIFSFGRLPVFVLYSGLLVAINITGCFGHLGLLSLVQSASLLDDRNLWFLESVLHFLTPFQFSFGFRSWWLTGFALLSCSPYIGASMVPLFQTLPSKWAFRLNNQRFWSDVETLFQLLEPHLILGKYVKFASVTTTRWEIILQVKNDTDADFVDWENLYKPCNINHRPPFMVWLMPGVDWQLWFVGLAIDHDRPAWVDSLMVQLLQKDPDVCSLFATCPIMNPAAIQCAVYEYRFVGDSKADGDEKGTVWQRKFVKILGTTLRKRPIK